MRRRRHEEPLSHEAWAIPYADLMTLLLAFFVVMYAVSVVNEGKYRVMSESLIQAFNGSSSALAPLPATTGRVNTSAAVSVDHSGAAVSPVALPIPLRPPPVSGAGSRAGAGQQNLDTIEDQVRRALQPLIERKLVVVRHQQSWLEIEIRTDILFPSGVAQLSPSADTVLQRLATILARFPNPLRVEGFTDNVPIST
ncbi:MAG: flagellar motor protein MotB, partial [Rhodanobacter sp.]